MYMSDSFNLVGGLVNSIVSIFSFLPETWTNFLTVGFTVILLWFLIKVVLKVVGTFL